MKQQETPTNFETLADQLAPISVNDIVVPDVSERNFEDLAQEFDKTVDKLLRHTPRSRNSKPKRHLELAGGSLTVEADYWRDLNVGWMDTRGTQWLEMTRAVRLELVQPDLEDTSATLELSTRRTFHVDNGRDGAGRATGMVEEGYSAHVPRPVQIWQALGGRTLRDDSEAISKTVASYELPNEGTEQTQLGLYLFANGTAILKAVKRNSMKRSEESKSSKPYLVAA